jgi:hypothetical protein
MMVSKNSHALIMAAALLVGGIFAVYCGSGYKGHGGGFALSQRI